MLLNLNRAPEYTVQFSNKSNSLVKTPGIKWLETCSFWHWWHDSLAAVSCFLQSFAFTISLKCICRSYSLFLSMSVSLSLQADVFFWGLCKSACSWSLSSQTPLPLASSSPAVNRPPVSFLGTLLVFFHPFSFLYYDLWGVTVWQALHLKCLTWQPTPVMLLHPLPHDLKYEGTTNRKVRKRKCRVVGFH